jgi:hypothetical protein
MAGSGLVSALVAFEAPRLKGTGVFESHATNETEPRHSATHRVLREFIIS